MSYQSYPSLVCTDVWVHFRQGNGQHIRFSDGPTASRSLYVVRDDKMVSVNYINASGRSIKVIQWPLDVIKEVACEGISTEK